MRSSAKIMEKIKMKTIIITIIALLIGFGVSYVIFSPDQTSVLTDEVSSQQQYTCGMHPQIISDEPGYCPICGMKLTPKKDGSGPAEGSITIDPTTVQNMGLKTAVVSTQPIIKSVRAFGKIQYSEPLIQTINVKIPGWVENLYVDYEGAAVKTGQPLLELYSPELVAAQREYLVALESSRKLSAVTASAISASDLLLDASVFRLQNWDISPDQIRKLAKTGQLTKSMVIRSPFNGVVISKKAVTGDHLKAGAEIFRIADISEVWGVAHIYEQDIPFINPGQIARVELPYLPGQVFEGEVSYISPYLDNKRQVEIRLDMHNPDLQLKPEMYAEITFESQIPGDRLALPLKAIINSGLKEIVYIANNDGSFEPRVVRTGAVGNNDYIEIISGLSEGEKVVVSGQFLLDSESRLNESLNMAHNHGGHSAFKRDDHSMSEDQDKHEHIPESSHKENTHNDERTDLTELSGIYTCPMPVHFHILQYGEGKCPECGMDLVPVEETDNSEVYFCPMLECRVVSSEPGSCPKCGMHLIKLEQEKDHD